MTDMTLQQASELAIQLKQEIAKAVVGQQQVIHETLIALIAGGNVLIEGVPGLGKTLLVRALASTFSGQFKRIQFTPDLMPADVTGHTLYDMNSKEFSVRKGPVFTNLLLADEINRAPAKTQSALLEVMQERQVTIEGVAHPVPLPFMTLATQNPLEQEGTYPLPEAQLDRFLLKIYIDYPDDKEESLLVAAVTNKQTGDQLNIGNVNAIASPEIIQAMQHLAAEVEADQSVIDYAVRIVRATRDWQGLSIGAGPRGSISLIRAARAQAMLHARDHITPDDIKDIALPVLRHRVALAPEMELEGYNTDQILQSVLDKIEAPRQ
ncbi:MAG TPA: MoxR family ATPase [Leucothrix mucor]|nr:MoxR family ATPase [Leucothrix mucor]